MKNSFAHVELRTGNLARAKEFYGDLLDWELEDVDMGDMIYTMVGVGEGTGGGMMQTPDDGSRWVSYIQVSDVVQITERAVSLGATVVQPRTPIPGNGFFSVVIDPTGAMIGFLQHGS